MLLTRQIRSLGMNNIHSKTYFLILWKKQQLRKILIPLTLLLKILPSGHSLKIPIARRNIYKKICSNAQENTSCWFKLVLLLFYIYITENLVNVSLYPCEDTSDGRTNGFEIW